MVCPKCNKETSSVIRMCEYCGHDIFTAQKSLEAANIKAGVAEQKGAKKFFIAFALLFTVSAAIGLVSVFIFPRDLFQTLLRVCIEVVFAIGLFSAAKWARIVTGIYGIVVGLISLILSLVIPGTEPSLAIISFFLGIILLPSGIAFLAHPKLRAYTA